MRRRPASARRRPRPPRSCRRTSASRRRRTSSCSRARARAARARPRRRRRRARRRRRRRAPPGRDVPCVVPKVSTMKTTSRPSSSTPLNDEGEAVPVEAPRGRRAAPRASSSSRAKIASSSCSALKPLARRIALRSHCRPNTSRRRADHQAQRVDRDHRRAPARARRRAPRARRSRRRRPTSAERQPRVSPTASTIVSASTISTALARNADRISRVALIDRLRPRSTPRIRPDGQVPPRRGPPGRPPADGWESERIQRRSFTSAAGAASANWSVGRRGSCGVLPPQDLVQRAINRRRTRAHPRPMSARTRNGG